MSGHNKWSKVKHKKAAADATKSKVFGKLAQFIAVESRKARGDTTSPGLRAAIDKARAVNMPSENIQRAVQKGAGGDAADLETVTYEAYGPGGAALIIEAVTESRNRTGNEIKHLLSEHGSSLATPGAALWAFEKTSGGWVPKTTTEINTADCEKLDSLVEALEEHDDVQQVFTNI
jgi:YebC/PmpR family DNA-binding regulatory protein